MNKYKIIVSGGGTGGHIFPAISIANTLKQRFPEAEIRFVGADNRMEMERVPAAGYPIVGLPICGFDRAHLWKNIEVVRKLFKSLRMAKKIIREFRPDIAIGVGGYASGPLLWAAASAGIPTLIQEQNSYAGVTNKLLSKRASKICVAYEGMERFFPVEKIVLTGNPVRKDLEHGLEKREEAFGFFRLNPAKPTVLMIGGSLGARTMNTGMLHGLDDLIASGIQPIWQTGRYYYEDIKRQLVGKDTRGLLWYSDFISRMDYAYAAADLVVSRAGAGTISELCLLKKPAILIPSPNVAEDHQTKNALAVVDRQGAVLLPDKEAGTRLADTIKELMADTQRLQSFGEHIGQLAQHGSAERIVDEIEKLIQKHSS